MLGKRCKLVLLECYGRLNVVESEIHKSSKKENMALDTFCKLTGRNMLKYIIWNMFVLLYSSLLCLVIPKISSGPHVPSVEHAHIQSG